MFPHFSGIFLAQHCTEIQLFEMHSTLLCWCTAGDETDFAGFASKNKHYCIPSIIRRSRLLDPLEYKTQLKVLKNIIRPSQI